jgi:hypothetical protein
VLSKALELGSAGIQWTPPPGSIGEHTDTRLVIRGDDGLYWHVEILPQGFAIGEGEEAALSEDLHQSAAGIAEAKIGRIGNGRCVRIIRRMREGFAGHLIVPVARGAIDVRVLARDADAARSALDGALATLEIVSPAERREEVELPEAGCAFIPPKRFLPVPAPPGSGKGLLVRTGLDGWRRVIEVWRIGRHKLRGKDLPAELAQHAAQSVADWPDSNSEAHRIDDFGVCVQVEQYVAYAEHGEPRHTVMRYWIAGDTTLWRLGSSAPLEIEPTTLQDDLNFVQETFHRV